MAPTGTRTSKRQATSSAGEPPAKKVKTAAASTTTAAPNTSKKVTARSAVLAAAKNNPVTKKSSSAPAKKTATKSTSTAPAKKAATASTSTTPATKATTKSTAAATKKAPAKAPANAPATTTKKATAKAPAKATASTTKKAAAPAKAPAATSKKRKKDDDDEKEDEEQKAKESARPIKKVKAKVVINKVPSQKLDVYVCGEGSSGELGLGTAKNAIDVKRPRLNPLLSAQDVGVVQVAVGGMHCLALTKDNKILSWGVNDHGALGRDTAWDGGMKDMDGNKSDSGSDDGSDSGLNPRESTPTAIPSESFPEGTVFVKVAAGDSLSLALTDDGQVYGWGTFRVSCTFSLSNQKTDIAIRATMASSASPIPPLSNILLHSST